MNKLYVQKLQELITEKLQTERLTVTQIEELLKVSGELNELKESLPF